jgi:ribonuclease E
MSRQRLRAGVVAGSTIPCPHCGGQGIVRSIESTALRVLRGLEEEAQRQRSSALAVRAPTEVTIYALNKKRREIAHLETEYDLAIHFEGKDDMLAGTFEIERVGHRSLDDRARPLPPQERSMPTPGEPVDKPAHGQTNGETHAEGQGGVPGGSKRRRRRRRGRDRDRAPSSSSHDTDVRPERPHAGTESPERQRAAAPPQQIAEHQPNPSPPPGESPSSRKRRRRRRGGRRPGESGLPGAPDDTAQNEPSPAEISAANASHHPEDNGARPEFDTDLPAFMPNAPSEPVWSLSAEARPVAAHREAHAEEPIVKAPPVESAETVAPPSQSAGAEQVIEPAPAGHAERPATPGPPKRGWWQRPFRDRE